MRTKFGVRALCRALLGADVAITPMVELRERVGCFFPLDLIIPTNRGALLMPRA